MNLALENTWEIFCLLNKIVCLGPVTISLLMWGLFCFRVLTKVRLHYALCSYMQKKKKTSTEGVDFRVPCKQTSSKAVDVLQLKRTFWCEKRS